MRRRAPLGLSLERVSVELAPGGGRADDETAPDRADNQLQNRSPPLTT